MKLLNGYKNDKQIYYNLTDCSPIGPKITKLSNSGYLHEYVNGHKRWYLNGVLHREDGPAIVCSNEYKEWYVNGKFINCNSQKHFLQLMKLKAFW
jgi:hypothetical protein